MKENEPFEVKTMKYLILLACLFCVGCEEDYSGHIKEYTTAGEVRSVEIKLPRSGSTFTIKDRETVRKLILELEEITKQLKDAEERMPKKETASD
jgi:hypothetical protein